MAEPWHDKYRYITRVEDRFLESITTDEGALIDLIIKKMRETMSFSAGRLELTDIFFEQVEAFKAGVGAALGEWGYVSKVQGLVDAFGGLDKYTVNEHKLLNKIDVEDFIERNPIKQLMVKQVQQSLRGSGLAAEVVQPLADILITNASAGISISDAANYIELSVNDNLTKFAKRAATDGINQYDGAVQNEIRREFKLNNFFYVNSLIKTSRAFCIEAVSIGRITEEQMAKLISQYENNGQLYGMTTSVDNICQNRGGNNCRHSCIPVV